MLIFRQASMKGAATQLPHLPSGPHMPQSRPALAPLSPSPPGSVHHLQHDGCRQMACNQLNALVPQGELSIVLQCCGPGCDTAVRTLVGGAHKQRDDELLDRFLRHGRRQKRSIAREHQQGLALNNADRNTVSAKSTSRLSPSPPPAQNRCCAYPAFGAVTGSEAPHTGLRQPCNSARCTPWRRWRWAAARAASSP